MISRRKPLQRNSPIARGEPPKRSALKRKKGRVGTLREKGNADAKKHYFKAHGTEMYEDKPAAYCQACQRLTLCREFTSHHKLKDGEELTNKLAMCARCHFDYVHDRQRTDRRKYLETVETSVVTGGFIDWGHLAADFAAFNNSGRPDGHEQEEAF